jgi:hypothetical protein
MIDWLNDQIKLRMRDFCIGAAKDKKEATRSW